MSTTGSSAFLQPSPLRVGWYVWDGIAFNFSISHKSSQLKGQQRLLSYEKSSEDLWNILDLIYCPKPTSYNYPLCLHEPSVCKYKLLHCFSLVSSTTHTHTHTHTHTREQVPSSQFTHDTFFLKYHSSCSPHIQILPSFKDLVQVELLKLCLSIN